MSSKANSGSVQGSGLVAVAVLIALGLAAWMIMNPGSGAAKSGAEKGTAPVEAAKAEGPEKVQEVVAPIEATESK